MTNLTDGKLSRVRAELIWARGVSLWDEPARSAGLHYKLMVPVGGEQSEACDLRGQQDRQLYDYFGNGIELGYDVVYRYTCGS